MLQINQKKQDDKNCQLEHFSVSNENIKNLNPLSSNYLIIYIKRNRKRLKDATSPLHDH